MMMAMWRGTALVSGIARVVLIAASHRHQIGFLRMQDLVDLGDVPVGELLDIVLRTALLVFGNRFGLEQILEMRDRVAANVAYRNARILGFFMYDLDQLLAPLLGKRRHRYAY